MTIRELTSHKVNPANDKLIVRSTDNPGPGGAHHSYVITIPHDTERDFGPVRYSLDFQNGAIEEVGVNGVTHEALLSILIDRLECFQNGPYKSPYNDRALAGLLAAQQALKERTEERMARGVEGTMQK